MMKNTMCILLAAYLSLTILICKRDHGYENIYKSLCGLETVKCLSDIDLTVEEELRLVGLAIQMIEADNNIEYSEVKFFKKIRSRLSVSDEQILEQYPCKENLLFPDISVSEDPIWNFVTFTKFMEYE